MVERVVEFRAEPHIQVFPDSERFLDRSIQVGQTWAKQRIPSHVPKGSRRRHQISAGIEVAAGFPDAIHAENHFPAEIGVQAGTVRRTGVAIS